MEVDSSSLLSASHSHAREAAELFLRRCSEDSVYGSSSFSGLEDDSDPVSSLCFLVRLGDRLDEDGNHAESIRCAESALVVQQVHRITQQDVQQWCRDHPNDVSASTVQTLDALLSSSVAQAKALVLRCNTLAVREFNVRRFDAAGYYLAKALYLTSKPGEPVLSVLARSGLTNASSHGNAPSANHAVGTEVGVLSAAETATLGSVCFCGDDEERRRLQAATCNNAGCMERRRGRLDISLLYLREAASIEGQLDATGQSSASTYLNLCTVLNDLQHYAEAVVTAERACNALQLALLEQSEEEEVAKRAMMLAVGQYNLGVSLERRGQSGDHVAAERAYQQCLQTSERYLIDQVCPSVEAAVDAIRRMKNPRSASVVRRSVPRAETGTAEKAPRAPEAAPAAATSNRETAVAVPFSWVSPTAQSHKTTAGGAAPLKLPQVPIHSASSSSGPADQRVLTTQAVRDLAAAPAAAHPAERGETDISRTAGGQRRSESTPITRSSHSGTSGHSSNPPLLAATQNTLFRPNHAPAHAVGWLPKHPPMLAPLPALNATVSGVPSIASDPSQRPVAQTMPAALPFSASSAIFPLPASGARPPPMVPTQPTAPRGARPGLPNPLGRRTFGSAGLGVGVGGSRPLSATSSATGAATTATATAGPGSSTGRNVLGRPLSTPGNSGTGTAGGRGQRGPGMSQAARSAERLRRENNKRKAKEAAQHDAEVAEALHEKMVQGMKREELRRCNAAAVVIQAMWRGVLARSFMSTMMAATCVLQRTTRRFLVRRREFHRIEAAEAARQRVLREERERAAARVLQARVRQFLNRCRILREFRASRMRTFYAARAIQRGYRAHRMRLAEHVAALAEAHRREDLQRAFAQRVAARRIQSAYRAYQVRQLEAREQQGRQRRHHAATAIQAVVRGVLTRSWFRYYKAYRRDQAVRSAANQRRLVLIQACCRATLSSHLIRQRRLDQLTVQRQRQLDTAATRIQCLWRCHVARIRLERLQAERARLDRRATYVQRWYRMCHARRAFLHYREGMRRLRAALRIQRWLREQRQLAKEREFAAYHAEQLRLRRVKQQRENAARLVQTCLVARDSEGMVAGMRRDFLKREWCALLWQRVGRAYAGRRDVALTLAISHAVAEKDRVRAEQTAAVLVLQRAWRCASAKDTVEQMRRERAAAHVIANNYKIYRAKKTLRELRLERENQRRDRAARTIQQAVRAAQHHRRAVEMSTYYRGKHQKKMQTLRRQEAATTIQAVWRGHVTRQAVAQERAVIAALAFFAIRIQRAWRHRRARQQLTRELQVRAAGRQFYDREAITIQCFWRKMMAAEKVAQLREAHRQQERAALALQCWWRQALARRAALRQYLLRREEDELALFYALKWEHACTVIQAHLRTRASALHTRETHRVSMLGQLRHVNRVRFMLRGDAATKIQAAYRGHYERVYVRGLRREKAEAERQRAEEAARQRRAAVCIQCAWRSYCARGARRALHDAKVSAILASQEDYLATANPEEIVRELFWAESAVAKRQFAQERLQRQQKRQEAATKIQKAFRSVTSTRAVKDVHEYKTRDKAARTIQAHWRAFKVHATAHKTREREQAATVIQRYVRGWLVRKEWGPWRQAMELERRQAVRKLDLYDHAATVVQAAWRRTLAQRYTAYLRQVLQEEKDAAAREEAASLIQEAYRQHLKGKVAQTI